MKSKEQVIAKIKELRDTESKANQLYNLPGATQAGKDTLAALARQFREKAELLEWVIDYKKPDFT